MDKKNITIIAVVVILIALFPLLASLMGSNPAVGTWAYTVETPFGPWSQTLTINKDMTGTVEVTEPLPGSWPITDASIDGKSLSYSVTSVVEGQRLNFDFKGNVEGDVITGVYASALGNSRVTGTRKKSP